LGKLKSTRQRWWRRACAGWGVWLILGIGGGCGALAEDVVPLVPQTSEAAGTAPAAYPPEHAAPDEAVPVATPLVPPGPSPSGADVRVLPIDLPSALRLANVSNPTIGVARERVREAYGRLLQAKVLWLPDLEGGPAYVRHDGLLQNAAGLIFPVSKWNFFIGGGPALTIDTSDAIFAPLIARRLVQAQEAAAQVVTDDIQLNVALTYLDLLRAYGALAVNAETLANAQEMLQVAEAAEKAGFGKTPADANRARAEVALRRQERIDLEGEAAVVSARLAQLLLLEPTLDLRPTDPAVIPIALVLDGPLDELVATGLMNRPELAESRSLVAAALERWRQTRIGPLLPQLTVTYLAGYFGGGTHDETQRFGGRGDALAQAVWTVHNFGAGEIARNQVSRAQYNEAGLHDVEVQAQVAADVTAAAKLVRSRQRTLDSAQEAVRQAEETWRRVLKWTKEVGFRRIRQIEAIEMLIAEQSLNEARVRYLNEVIEFNRAQFRLYWAMGQPPLCALPQAVAAPPVQVPVAPPPEAQRQMPYATPEMTPPPRPVEEPLEQQR
jgi:outer membrane protein TolC